LSFIQFILPESNPSLQSNHENQIIIDRNNDMTIENQKNQNMNQDEDENQPLLSTNQIPQRWKINLSQITSSLLSSTILSQSPPIKLISPFACHFLFDFVIVLLFFFKIIGSDHVSLLHK